MLTREECAQSLAALLTKDYGRLTTVIEKTDGINRMDKVRILSAALRYQDSGDGVEGLIRLICGSSDA